MPHTRCLRLGTAALVLALAAQHVRASDPLPSWNDGASKKAIVEFVEAVTTVGSPDFVPLEQRIATFDNDGTLWCEQPSYFQGIFALDRVAHLAPEHPEWKEKQPFKAILEGDRKAIAAFGEHDIAEIVAVTHSGMTTDEFREIVRAWITTAKHPVYHRLYVQCVYQPQLELLEYLRSNGFETWIVSGGGVDFMRVFAERVYGVPPERVIGSSGKTKFEMRDGKPVLVKLPEIGSIDDKDGKPINIELHIGRRPILAFGNSDGDQQMLEWTAVREGRSLCLLVHHDDATREVAYDRESKIGRLDKAWDEATRRGWTVVSMKDDWKEIFPAIAGK